MNEVVHTPSGEKMAMKVVNLLSEAVSREHICRELNTLRFANCPSILEFLRRLHLCISACAE